MFVEVDKKFLNEIATDSDRVPTLYYSKYWLVRRFFWSRLRYIHRFMLRDNATGTNKSCLDFGGGGGVFLPTLSSEFGDVVCVDLEYQEANKIIENYEISNIELKVSDITKKENIGSFDVIVAADVLEHFKQLSQPSDAIRSWLKDDGILYTSLPTENFIYILLRKIFGITKPFDHYHTGYDVEKYLSSNGFEKVRCASIPLYWRIFPLFLISSWKKKIHI